MKKSFRNFKILFSALLSAFCIYGHSSDGLYNVFNFGAKGDGKTLDTRAIQLAIDRCNKEGGGTVYLHKGCFVSGTIYLKDNVNLYIEAGAVLKASDNLDNFPVKPSKYPSYTGEFVTNKMLIYAEEVKNISISGRGTIDGNGDYWIEGPYGSPSFSVRPRIIHMRGCEDIQVRDITLYNSASWVQSYQSCKNLLIDGVSVNSRENKDIEKPRYIDARGRNTDGMDIIDCQKVRVSSCFIVSGDDGICLKSFSPDEKCRDITITNCVLSTNGSGIKIGTETAGGFEDITVSNCVVYDTRAEAIALLTADGANIERVTISNISLRNIKGAAIAIRLGVRNRPYTLNAKINKPLIKDIIIQNVQGTRISTDFGCSITGIPGYSVENVILKNINLEFEGEGTIADSNREIPEHETSYPSGRVFGRIPAYGFFIRHVNNLLLDNVWLRFLKDDHRPAVLCDDVEQLVLKGLKAQGTDLTPELIRLKNTRDVVISQSRPSIQVPVFLSVFGEKSDRIILQNNILRDVKEKYILDKNLNRTIIKEIDPLATKPALPDDLSFPLLGKIKTLSSHEIKLSRWSIGGETLDRDYADYHSYKQYLSPSGTKRVRLQGGWAKCEKVKGIYDFTWLDQIVDDAISQGVSPWIQTSYGNPIYEGGGQPFLAGGIPVSDEALKAWDNWVYALVSRYKDKVKEWEIWNEPDLSRKISAEEFAAFYVRTCDIIKKVQPESRIIALGLAGIGRTEFVTSILDILKAEKKLNYMDVLSYHGYSSRPEQMYPSIQKLRETLNIYNPKIELWQGENGAPSTPAGQSVGALSREDWSEITQAKWVLRRMMGDIGHDVDVVNVFTLSDLWYSGGDHLTGYNSKGLLKSNPDNTIERPKLSYYAYQHTTSLFSEKIDRIKSVLIEKDNADLMVFAYKKEKKKGNAVVFWLSEAKPSDIYPPKTISFSVSGIKIKDPVIVDLLTGKVYKLPAENISAKDKNIKVSGIPAADYPLVLVEKEWLDLTQSFN